MKALLLVARAQSAYDDGKEGEKTDMDEAGVLAATMNQTEVQNEHTTELERAIRRRTLSGGAQASANFLAVVEPDTQSMPESAEGYALSSGAANFLSNIIPNRPHGRIFSPEEVEGLVSGLIELRGAMRAKTGSLDYRSALEALFGSSGMTYRDIASEIFGNSVQSAYNSLNNFAQRCAENARNQEAPVLTVEDLIRLGGVDAQSIKEETRPVELPAVRIPIVSKGHDMASIAMGPVFAPEPPKPAINNPYELEQDPIPKPRATDDDDPLAWQRDALCAQTDPEAFFPEKGGSTRDAKKICTSCDVREQCLHYALENDERFGIWGGLSERERRKLKPRAKR